MDQATEDRLREDLRRAFSDPVSPEELAEADLMWAEADACQEREYAKMQRTSPGSVGSRIVEKS